MTETSTEKISANTKLIEIIRIALMHSHFVSPDKPKISGNGSANTISPTKQININVCRHKEVISD